MEKSHKTLNSILIQFLYSLEQGSGTYGSRASGDGIWLPDNFELKKNNNLRPPPCNFL